jgi:hypothetical protein
MSRPLFPGVMSGPIYISLAAALGVPIGDAKNITNRLKNWKCWAAVLASFSLGFLRFLLKVPLQSNKAPFSPYWTAKRNPAWVWMTLLL